MNRMVTQRWFLRLVTPLIVILFTTGCVDPNSSIVTQQDKPASILNLPSSPTSDLERLPDLSDGISLQTALEYAAINNPALEASFNRWKAALENIEQVQALPDPKFSYTYFIKEVETRVGPQRQAFSLTQAFPWFGTLQKKSDAAGAKARAAQQEYEKQKLQLFYQVKIAYYEYYYLSRTLKVTEQNLLLLRTLEEATRSRYETGAANQNALLRFQVDIAKAEDHLQSMRDLRAPLSAKLNATMNRPMTPLLPWPGQIDSTNIIGSDEQLLETFLEHNPELAKLSAEIEKTHHEIDLAKLNYYPDLSLGLTFIDTRHAVMPTRDSGEDPLAAMFSMSLPLNQSKYQAGERQARRSYRAALKEKENRQNNLEADLRLALYGFRNARRKIDLYAHGLIPKAEQSLSVSQQAFSADRSQFMEVIDATRTLLEFRLNYERAQVDCLEKLAQIEMLVGKPLTR